MKRIPWDFIALIVLFGAITYGIAIAAREARDRSDSRRIYFSHGNGLYYILAREYRTHWLIDDRLVLDTDKGPIVLDSERVREMSTLEKIRALKAAGIIPIRP